MALDIIGYNVTFDAFANFAKVQSDAGKQKAVARVDTSGAQGLAGRTIEAASGDWVGVGQGRLWTLKEADNAVNKVGTPPPNVMYYSEGTLSLSGLDGSTEQARAELLKDIVRPSDYTLGSDSKKGLLGGHCGFTFNLPNGKSLVTNSSAQGQANAKIVLDELEALCGKIHPRQAANVMMMTSQSGLSQLKGGLEKYGVGSDEHSAVDFTIARNEITGNVMIRYTSPKELSFAFDWTATIATDGTVSTTPLRFADEATLKEEVDATVEVIRNARVVKGAAPEEKERVVSFIIENARHDRDLMALIRMHRGEVAMGVAVDGTNHIRSPEGIRKKLDALRANIDELHAVSNGNRRAFETGLKQIAHLAGAAFAPGVITRICKSVADADLDALKIKGLSKSSSPEAIFETACNIDRITRRQDLAEDQDRPHEAHSGDRGRHVLADLYVRQDPAQPEHRGHYLADCLDKQVGSGAGLVPGKTPDGV